MAPGGASSSSGQGRAASQQGLGAGAGGGEAGARVVEPEAGGGVAGAIKQGANSVSARVEAIQMVLHNSLVEPCQTQASSNLFFESNFSHNSVQKI